MRRDSALAVAAAGVVAVALLVPLVAPAAIADPDADRPVRPGHVEVDEMAVSVGAVTGETAELRLHTRLVHRGPTTGNVSVRYRAIDTESGLVAAEKRVAVGDLEGFSGNPQNVSLEVPREGGYRLEATVFRNEIPMASTTTTVSGVSALTPEYARTSVGFTEDEVIEPLAVSVTEADQNTTTLAVTASLTNRGDEASGDLTVEVRVRQVDSNLVADRDTQAVGTIDPGRTGETATEVTVPSDYNYVVDAVLLKDGVVVDTGSTVVQLDPTKTVPQNQTQEDIEFSVEDFEQDSDQPAGAREEPTVTEEATPGFGLGVAVAALLGAALLARRWDR